MEKTKTTERVKNNAESKVETKVELKAATPVAPTDNVNMTNVPTEQVTESQSKFSLESASIQEQCLALKQLYNNIVKSLKALENEHARVLKSTEKRNKKKKEHKETGFENPKYVCGELAKFLGVPDKTAIKGPSLTSMIWDKFSSLGLTYEKDNRCLRVNEKISKMLNVPMSVNDSTTNTDPNGFNFKTLQSVIKNSGFVTKIPKEELSSVVPYHYVSARKAEKNKKKALQKKMKKAAAVETTSTTTASATTKVASPEEKQSEATSKKGTNHEQKLKKEVHSDVVDMKPKEAVAAKPKNQKKEQVLTK